MRGADINYNPVFFSYTIVTTEDVRYIIAVKRIKVTQFTFAGSTFLRIE